MQNIRKLGKNTYHTLFPILCNSLGGLDAHLLLPLLVARWIHLKVPNKPKKNIYVIDKSTKD